MGNITLEDLLQKHFGLEGSLEVPEIGGWTINGLVAYGKMTDFLYDLSKHVRLHVSAGLAKRIVQLVDTFDEYEHTNY